ncbi:hypothetical protein BC830DRAFT_667609 [Chytriomyces sp. MP71]|nr:hypothetical protein BC830DRAFT_667609 [Chytriomyces sp. MP71]
MVKKTVQSLGPLLSTPITVMETASVSQVCVVMAAKGVDAVLLVDSSGQLSGILTVGDVSRRMVAHGIEIGRTRCSQVMTPSPLSVRSTAPVSQALRQMVARRCRHLPVLSVGDDEDEVELAGILDITECVFARLGAIDAKALQRMTITVRDVLADPSAATPVTGPSASIAEACATMRDTRHTGVLVVDESGDSLVGILTNKDVLVRVLATGLDPSEVTVHDVLTPQPDFVTPFTSVLEALQMLRDGDYLHLPVLEDGKPVGLVDVLMLTMSILDYMLKIDRDINDAHALESVYSEGPLWNRFWNSSEHRSDQVATHAATVAAAEGPSDFDVLDNDDAISITSAGAFYRKQRARQQMRELEMAMGRQMSIGSGAALHAPGGGVTSPAIGGDAGSERGSSGAGSTFVFKVHDVDGTIHRFNAPCASLGAFVGALEHKLGRKGIRMLYKAALGKRELRTQHDLTSAVAEARGGGVARVVVYVVGDSGEVASTQTRAGGPAGNRNSMDTVGLDSSGVLGWVKVNVGGVRFETAGAGLVTGSKYFATVLQLKRSSDELKVDRDGDLFRHVLHFLRSGQLSSSAAMNSGLLRDLTVEADFYGVPGLMTLLQERIKEFEEVVVVQGRDDMISRLGKGWKVCLIEEEGKRWIMKRE